MNNHRLHHIDVWRFVAISFVLIAHVVGNSHPWYRQTFPWLVPKLQSLGQLGVQIFFCISGFVICRGMLRERSKEGHVDLAGFYIRRAYRIFPPLACYIVFVGFLAALNVVHVPLLSFVKASIFLCNFKRGSCGWELGHTWSLAYEEQFYLVFPVFFIFACVAQHRGRLILAGAIITATAYIAGIFKAGFVSDYAGNFIYLLSGCLCALYWDSIAPKLKAIPTSLWLLIALIIPATVFFAVPDRVEWYIYPILLPALICIAIFGTPVQIPAIGSVFLAPSLSHLGRISYGVYLWQQLATANYRFASPLQTLVFVSGVFALAHVSFIFFEQPLIARGTALSKRRTRRFAASMVNDPSVHDPMTHRFFD